MDCPLCNVELKMTDRQGIEIDYCPQCRGVWLDRGELDKIIERSTSEPNYNEPQKGYPNENRDYGHENYKHDERYQKRKKKSILGELFDFD